jgi:hypothetical protein
VTRRDIPTNIRNSQLWGGQANVDVDGNADNPNLIRVQLPAEYERDWTIHIPAPIFQTGAARIATGAGAGLTPAAENVDVVITYGGALGVTQTIRIDYPVMGRTFGVRGSSVQVSTARHARGAVLKDPCRIFAELVDAEPPSLNREALPTFTGDVFTMPIAPATRVVPIPDRAVEVSFPATPASVTPPKVYFIRVQGNSASLSAILSEIDRATATIAIVNVAQSYYAQMQWIPIPQWCQGILLSDGAVAVAPAPDLTPIFRIAP